MPTPGLLGGVAERWGGGGGGGAAQAVGATDMVGGGGGGSGGYSKTGFAAAMVRGGVLVTVGAGGINTGRRRTAGRRASARSASPTAATLALARTASTSTAGAVRGPRRIGDVAAPGVAGFTGHIQIGPSATDFATAVGGWLALGGTPQPGQCGVGGFLPGPNAAPNTGAGGSGAAVNQLAERVWNDALRRQRRLGPVRRDGVYLRRPRRELEPVRVRRAGPRGARWLAWTWTGRFRRSRSSCRPTSGSGCVQILARAPWQEANPLIMAIGEQLRTAQLPAKHRAAGMPEAPDGRNGPPVSDRIGGRQPAVRRLAGPLPGCGHSDRRRDPDRDGSGRFRLF